MKEIKIDSRQEGQRIDKFIRKYLNDAPLSFIYKLFRLKDVKVNGKKADISYVIKTDDIIRIYVTDKQLEEFNKPKDIVKLQNDLHVVYEDENILIVNKPAGILVHGDEKEKRLTLSNQVLNYLYIKGEFDPKVDIGFTPAPAHRLDRNTSGLVLFGKNIKALQELLELFKEKEEIEKEYYALLDGSLNKGNIIEAPLLKDEKRGFVEVNFKSKDSKSARTEYEIVKRYKYYTLVIAKLITGRTHQLRVHFAYINHPIIGDTKYGNFQSNKKFEKLYSYTHQFLHAYRIRFKQKEGFFSYLDGKTFIAPLFKKEEEILKRLDEHKNLYK